MDVIAAIRTKLDEAASECKQQSGRSDRLTQSIHRKVAFAARVLADDRGIKFGKLNPKRPPDRTLVVYCTGGIIEDSGKEYLFDHCWLTQYDNENKTNGYLIECNLAMEIERDFDFEEAHYDFQKLIIARADVKVMVCAAKTCENAEELLKQLDWQIQLSDGSARSSYLLSCYCEKEQAFHYGPL